MAASFQFNILDRRELQRLGTRYVSAAVRHQPGAGAALLAELQVEGLLLPFIDTVLLRETAAFVLALGTRADIHDIEIFDSGHRRPIYLLLHRLAQVHQYRVEGTFDIAALGLSLAPDRSLLNKRPVRTAERTLHRALSMLALGLDMPVFIAVGNDGPTPGFVNPWACAPGVFAITAASGDGQNLYTHANRPLHYAGTEPWHLFAAWGVDAPFALPRGRAKTEAMLVAETRVDLASIVGTEQLSLYTAGSGTSFAVPRLQQVACVLHQLLEHVRVIMADPAQAPWHRPYIRALIDTDIDREHPLFHLRLVDRRQHYGGLFNRTAPQQRVQLARHIRATGLATANLRFGSGILLRFLKRIARRVPSAEGADGHGYVSLDAALEFVREVRVSDLVNLCAPGDTARTAVHQQFADDQSNPRLLPPDVATDICNYALWQDLILALPLKSRAEEGFDPAPTSPSTT